MEILIKGLTIIILHPYIDNLKLILIVVVDQDIPIFVFVNYYNLWQIFVFFYHVINVSIKLKDLYI